MQVDNAFAVAAPPERVFAYLVDVNRVVGCVPGATLAEVVDPSTFNGSVKIKVGPVTVGYRGTARITNLDESGRMATLEAEGRETAGQGSARARTSMTVTPEGEGSRVQLTTDFDVVGRVAQFGSGIMADVSRRLVEQMAQCIRRNLEGAEAAAAATTARPPAPPSPLADHAGGSGPGPKAAPVDAVALAASILRERLRRLPPAAAVAVALLPVLLLAALIRRGRRR